MSPKLLGLTVYVWEVEGISMVAVASNFLKEREERSPEAWGWCRLCSPCLILF